MRLPRYRSLLKSSRLHSRRRKGRSPRAGREALTLIEVVVVLAILATLSALLLAAVQRVRASASRAACCDRLRQLGLALHQYHTNHSSLPPGVSHPALLPGVYPIYGPDTDPYPLLSWLGRVLPYVEQESLWNLTTQAYQADRYLIKNPPHLGVSTPVSFFLCPADSQPIIPLVNGATVPPAATSYLGVSGTDQNVRDGLLFLDSRIRFSEILDGLSATLLIGERPPRRDLVYGRWYGGWGYWGTANSYLGVTERDTGNGIDPCPFGPYRFESGELNDPCAAFHFWSLHPGGANFAFADGSCRFLPYSAATILPALATRAGGEFPPPLP